jgi:hypothetical protein
MGETRPSKSSVTALDSRNIPLATTTASQEAMGAARFAETPVEILLGSGSDIVMESLS